VSHLPHPDDRPQADVVLYDGECNFCIRGAQRVNTWSSGERVAFLPIGSAEVAERYPDLGPDRLQREMVVVDRSGRRHGGADAIRYLSRRLPKLWWLALPLHIPGFMPLWRFLYRVLARNRYLLGGKREPEPEPCREGVCSIPTADEHRR
jgi:predicted DCC family thiol-disulfide oxidoreductase YuxK